MADLPEFKVDRGLNQAFDRENHFRHIEQAQAGRRVDQQVEIAGFGIVLVQDGT